MLKNLLVVGPILGLGAISLLVIYSTSKSLATNQAVYWVLALGAFLATSQVDYHIWKSAARIIYPIALIFLILILFFADPIRGSVRWLEIGGFRFQPSELAKVATIFALAGYFAIRSATKIKNLAVSMLIATIPSALVFIEPDIGNSLAFLAIWLGIAAIAGLRAKTVVILLFIAALTIFIGFESLSSYQKERVATFADPSRDPLGTGYNIIQSKIAIGSGELFGRGLGRGSQSELNFLPESESDFIFASISEQLGFFGALLVVGFYLLLVIRILQTAQKSDRFGSLLSIGIVSFLTLQFTVNVGMNMALLPVTGITLPLVSYGGSSLITTMFLLGIAFSVHKYRSQHGLEP